MNVQVNPAVWQWLDRADLFIAWLVATIWVVHLVQAALGMRTIADLNKPEFGVAPGDGVSSEGGHVSPRVTIVVPARNEAHTMEPALRSLRNLEYPNYEVIAVNDRSQDGTGELMRRIAAEPGGAPVDVIDVTELPPGWLGKTHAMWLGAQQGTGDWILFTDADVVFRPDTLRRAIAYMEREGADHLVLFPSMILLSPGEYMLMAAFQALIGFGHRPWKVADPNAPDYIGVGAFNLVRRSAYDKIGTYGAMRLAVIDDMQLGKKIKQARLRQRAAFGKNLVRIHWATGAFGILHNLSKNFYAYVRFSTWLAVGAVAGLLLTNVLPFLGLVAASGWVWVGYAISVLCIFAIYVGTAKKTDIPPWYIISHPVSSTLIGYAILRSAFETLRNGGVKWRGTLYPLDELRKGME